jgi:hypothetical protein
MRQENKQTNKQSKERNKREEQLALQARQSSAHSHTNGA